jgi:hypothetical protein
MSHEVLAILGIVGALTNVGATIPYVRDIFRHKTKPQRAMWWIYAGLFTLLFAAQLDAKSGWVLALTAEYVLSSTLLAVLSLRYGYGSFHKRDVLSIGIAVLGLAAWLITDNPLLAILMVVIVDFAGFWLTIVKSWHAPHSETLISWELSLVGNVFGVFAVSSWSFTVLVYPVYAVIGTGLLVGVLIYRRRIITEDPGDY